MNKYIIFMISAVALIFGCSSEPSPRTVTMDFVGSVIEDDSLGIEKYLNVDMMVDRRLIEIPPEDSTQTHQYFRDRIIRNLTDDGGTRIFWKENRPVVNQEVVNGDTAQVELTLMDQKKGNIYYLTVYLYKSGKGWRVYKYL